MSNPPPRSHATPASRAEKMSILSAMLGPAALARLAEGQSQTDAGASEAPADLDADRVEWHRNKLLERLRAGGRPAPAQPPAVGLTRDDTNAPTRPVPGHPTNAQPAGRSLDAKLSGIADLNSIADEHPAIIARLVRDLRREDRVTILRSLPGPVARSIVQRLK